MEMAKTGWNVVITTGHDNPQDVLVKPSFLKLARVYLDLSSEILRLFGAVGDPGGHLEKLAVLLKICSMGMGTDNKCRFS